MLGGRRAGDRSSVGVYNDSSKRNSRIFEDQFTLGDVGAIKERVDRESPVVAELKTNVIVRCPTHPCEVLRLLMCSCFRSRMNSRLSLTSHTT